MKKVLFTHPVETDKTNRNKEFLESLGYEVFYENEGRFEYKDYMKDVEVLVCYDPFDHLDIDDFSSLRWIQISSMGFDQVPSKKVEERDIIVTNNRGIYSIPIGEWIVLNILELIKNRKQAFKDQENKKWRANDPGIKEIYKKTIGFLGTGDIPLAAVERLEGFGVRILGVNTSGRAVKGFDKTYPLAEIDKLIRESDVLINCLPETKETTHLIDKSKLEIMKKDAYLINISRGKVIKEEDLISHLEKGYLKGVALDVFEEEPLPQESKLWTMDRVLVTAHNSFMSEKTFKRRTEAVIDNLERYIKGKDLKNIVNIKRGY